jgi:hypothetical protein
VEQVIELPLTGGIGRLHALGSHPADLAQLNK